MPLEETEKEIINDQWSMFDQCCTFKANRRYLKIEHIIQLNDYNLDMNNIRFLDFIFGGRLLDFEYFIEIGHCKNWLKKTKIEFNQVFSTKIFLFSWRSSYLSSTHLNILCCPCLFFFFFFLLSLSLSLLSFDTPKANAQALVHILRFRLANHVHYVCAEKAKENKKRWKTDNVILLWRYAVQWSSLLQLTARQSLPWTVRQWSWQRKKRKRNVWKPSRHNAIMIRILNLGEMSIESQVHTYQLIVVLDNLTRDRRQNEKRVNLNETILPRKFHE